MHEDELMTIDYEEQDDAFLPDGWSEGDDFFADPSTWSGASQKSGQTDETQTEEESTEVDMGTEDVPTTDETEETAGQSAEQEAEEQSGQTEETVKRSRILKLKVNHEDQEVDIESMTDDELIAALQKSRAFDAMKDEQAKARYREVYHEQVSEGMTPAAAKLVAANEVGGKNYPLEDTVETEKPSTPAEAPTKPNRNFMAEVEQLKALYPEFKEMPDEVAKAVSSGANLLTAYIAYREKQNSKAAASLKKENEVLKQNAASAAKAPVRGVTGGGATNTKPRNDLLKGFDDDAW
ncbi:MAG: hypothetical protein IKY91_06830 [Akkermansia sp.]|nr:hypothetical protein [Akkermansia sp.]